MIVFNSFNLSRLLSQQVAPVCLVRDSGGRNAFLKFFIKKSVPLLGVTGRSRACGHRFFALSASTKAQSSGQNGHDHDRS